MAGDIITETKSCTIADLYTIAALHAKIIIHKMPLANKLLMVDRDIIITGSYGSFLFEQLLLQQIGLIKQTALPYIYFLKQIEVMCRMEPGLTKQAGKN